MLDAGGSGLRAQHHGAERRHRQAHRVLPAVHGDRLDLDAAEDDEPAPSVDEGVYIPPQWLSPTTGKAAKSTATHMKRTVLAIAPLSQMLDYTSRLRALSGGHGLFQMANEGFRRVSSQRAVDILRELGRM